MRQIKKWILMGTLTLLAACTNKGLEGIKVESENEKNLYTLGTRFGNGLKPLNLTHEEALVVARGFMDATRNQSLEAADEDGRAEKVQTFLSSRTDLGKKKAEQQGKDYMESFLKGGGQKTSSGLGFQILRPGEGNTPGPKDVVEIHYHASLPDGTVFASTRGTHKPAQYPLDKIVQGWAEGIRLIKPGGEVKLVIPPELGYGENGAPPKVPGNATLIMEVELLSIVKTEKKNSK